MNRKFNVLLPLLIIMLNKTGLFLSRVFLQNINNFMKYRRVVCIHGNFSNKIIKKKVVILPTDSKTIQDAHKCEEIFSG